MTPEDAQELVFATGSSTLYLGLLPPDNKDGYSAAGNDRRAAREGHRSQ